MERFGHTGLYYVFPFDYGFVGLDAANHVVRLDGKYLLEVVCGTVSFQGPHLHLAESLAAKLGFSAQRLLRDQGIRAGGPGVDLIFHKVNEFHHVDVTNRHRMVERLTTAPIEEH